MFDDESIDDILTRFTIITNWLIFVGKLINNDQKVRKIIEQFLKFGKSKQPP